MATVQDILDKKGPQVQTIGPQSSALNAAELMNQHKIGSLLVVDAGSVVGIITERDMLQRVLAARRDPERTTVREVMTSNMLCCQPHTSIDEARGVMKNHRVRHLPVVDDDGELHGMISIGDLNAFDSHSQEMTIHVLTEYIHGRA